MDAVFAAGYTNAGLGASGLTVTIEIVSVALADLTETQLVAAGSMTASSNINGLYFYRLASVTPTTHSYFARATTGGTVDQAELFCQVSYIASVLDPRTVEGAIDEIEALRLLLSAMVAKVSGGGTTTLTFRDTGDTKNRIVLTVDSSGNRSAVTLDAS